MVGFGQGVKMIGRRIFVSILTLATLALTALSLHAATTESLTLKAGETKTVDVEASPGLLASFKGWSSTTSSDCVSVSYASASSKSTTVTITANKSGTATVTLSYAYTPFLSSKKTTTYATYNVTVLGDPEQKTATASVTVGSTTTVTCTSSYASAWTASSDNTGVATVTASGTSATSFTPTITGVSPGTATITAKNDMAIWTITVTVSKAAKTASVAVVAGESKQQTFDLTTSANLSVSGGDAAVATAGSATTSAVTFTGVGEGTCDFAVGNAKADWTVTVNVTKAQKTASAVTVAKGATASSACTSSSASAWTASSANPSVATVEVSGSGTEATPVITGVSPGSTTVTVSNKGVVWTIPVTVPAVEHSDHLAVTVASGGTAKLSVGPAQGASAWTAKSSDEGIAKVTATGAGATTFTPTFTGVGVGATTANVGNATDSWTVDVTVTQAVYAASLVLAAGETKVVNCTAAAAGEWTATVTGDGGIVSIQATGASSTGWSVPVTGNAVGETTLVVENAHAKWIVDVTVTKDEETQTVSVKMGVPKTIACTSAGASAWSVTNQNEDVVSVEQTNGDAKDCSLKFIGLKVGMATVVAENDSAVWTITVVVEEREKEVITETLELKTEKSMTLEYACEDPMAWTAVSADPTIATVSPSQTTESTLAFAPTIRAGEKVGTTTVSVENGYVIYKITVNVIQGPKILKVGETYSEKFTNSKSCVWKNTETPSGIVGVTTSGGTTTSASTAYTVTVTAKTPGTATVKVYTGTKSSWSTSWSSTPLKTLEFEVVPPEPEDAHLLTGELRISEICPDDELLDPHGVNSGFIELLNCSDHAVNLKDWSLGRFNRGKEVKAKKMMSLPGYNLAPGARFVVWANEGYIAGEDGEIGDLAVKEPMMTNEEILKIEIGEKSCWVMPLKISPKKYPLVVLRKGKVDVDAVTVPVDTPSGWSVINLDPSNLDAAGATRRYLTAKPTPGAANEYQESVRVPPNVGPLYGVAPEDDDDDVSDNDPIALAKPGEDYPVTLDVNPVYNGVAADEIVGVTLVYRAGLDGAEKRLAMAKGEFEYRHGQRWTATIPSADLPGRGQLLQWKALITDAAGNETKSPSFLNPDDGYEWYGTIVEPGEGTTEGSLSAKLPTYHLFAAKGVADTGIDSTPYKLDNNSKMNQNYEDDSGLGARCAIFDSSTSRYYDNVRIDRRGNSSGDYKKKSHGLRFAKANPLQIDKDHRPTVNGNKIKDVRKTSFIAEWCDPSYLRQLTSCWLLNETGIAAPFEYPVRLNLNGKFYQLAFHSPRFTDDLIENIYAFDRLAYSYKNAGSFHLKNNTSTSAGAGSKKKTPDDGNESDLTVLHNFIKNEIEKTPVTTVVSDQTGKDQTGLDNATTTALVVRKFDLPAWIDYLAATRVTCENDDMWGNMGGFYDNAQLVDGTTRGTGTWRPLAWDLNASWGQWYQAHDSGVGRTGCRADIDWHKSHPYYGGRRLPTWLSKKDGSNIVANWNSHYTSSFAEPNYAVECVYQSTKFRRLYVRRLRTLMDRFLCTPGTDRSATPAMVEMDRNLELIREDAEKDRTCWGFLGTGSNAECTWVNCWGSVGDGTPDHCQPNGAVAGVQDIWDNYIVPRRKHLYVTHSITNTAKACGYGAELNAGIPEAQSPIAVLKDGITAEYLPDIGAVVIRNANAETVDLSGWKLRGPVAMTLPGGTVIDWKDGGTPGEVYVTADRVATIGKMTLTDQVVVGNGTATEGMPIALVAADGTVVISAALPDRVFGEDDLPEGATSAFDVSEEYDGEKHTIDTKALEAVVIPGVSADDVTITYAESEGGKFGSKPPKFTNAGEYEIYYKVSVPGYEDYVHAVKVTIKKAKMKLEGVAWNYSGEPFGYDGEEKSVIVTNLPETVMATYKGNVATNAGEYVAKVTLKSVDPNYSDPSSLDDCAWTIAPRAGVTVTVVGNCATNIFDGTEHTVTGFTLTSADDLYDVADVLFSGIGTTNGMNVATYPMGLLASDFSNTNANFSDVTFAVTDGELVITEAKMADDGEEPGVGPVPEGQLSNFDVTVAYDGEGHPLDTNALVTAVRSVAGEGAQIVYTLEIDDDGEIDWSLTPPVFTIPGEYVMWYGIEAENYEPFIHQARVTVLPHEGVTVTVVGNCATNVYDGAAHEVAGFTLTSDDDLYDVANVLFSGVGATNGTNVATYPMGLLASDFANTNANFSGVAFVVTDGELVILPSANAWTVEPTVTSKTYDGTAADYTLGAAKFGEVTVTFDGGAEPPVGAGIHTNTFSVAGTDDYAGLSTNVAYEIRKATYSFETIDFTNTVFTYDGEIHALTATNGLPQGVTVAYEGNTAVTAGVYTVTAKFTGDAANYEPISDRTATITVLPREGVTVTVVGNCATNVFDGAEHTVAGFTLTSDDDLYDVANVLFSGVGATNGTNVATYQMGLLSSDFANTNANFSGVAFVVTDGELVILPKPTITISIVMRDTITDVRTNGVSVVGEIELPADTTEIKLELVSTNTIPVFKFSKDGGVSWSVTNATPVVAIAANDMFTFMSEEAKVDDPSVTEEEVKAAIIEAIDDENKDEVGPKVDAVVDTAEKPAEGKVSGKEMAKWITDNTIRSADMAKSEYLAASVKLDTSVPITDGAEVEFVADEISVSEGFTFKLTLDGKDTPERLTEKIAAYILTTGDLVAGFTGKVDPDNVTINPDGTVTIRPDPIKTAEFFKIVISKDPGK